MAENKLITIENENGARLRVGERQYKTYYNALGFKVVADANDGQQVGFASAAGGEEVRQYNEDDYTKAELEEEAKNAGLTGVSSYNKAELVEALNNHYAQQNVQVAGTVNLQDANAGIDSTPRDIGANTPATMTGNANTLTMDEGVQTTAANTAYNDGTAAGAGVADTGNVNATTTNTSGAGTNTTRGAGGTARRG